MKKWLLLSLLLLSKIGHAQTVQQGFVLYVTSAPSGSCSAGAPMEVVLSAGTIYTCQSGTWTQVGSGGGSVTSVGLAGTANQITVTGATPITTSGSWTLSLPSSLVLPNGSTATTQSASDSSTKVATTAYADTAVTPPACSTVTYSATPTFSGASNVRCFVITLTGAVTSSTFSNGVTGQTYTFIVVQDSTGGRAFVPPSQMKQYGTWMATPSNEVVQQFVYDGTNLNAVAPWTPDTRPITANALDDEFDGAALSAQWTYQNQGTSSTTEQNGLLLFQPQVNNGAFNIVMLTEAYPAGSHSWVTKLYPQGTVGNGWGGICISDGTKYYSLLVGYNTNDFTGWIQQTWTNTSTPTTVTESQLSGVGAVWLKLTDDGSVNRTWQMSTNGVIFSTVKTEGRTASLTPTKIGICTSVTASSAFPNLVFDWFRAL